VGFCKIQLIDNLGRDPEMRYTPNGQSVTTFSVAVNQGVKNKETGEWSDATDWFNVSIWGDKGERAAETLRKGNKVFIEGRFKTREYEAKDQTKRTSLDLTADTFVALDAKEGSTEQDEGDFATAGAPAAPRQARPAERPYPVDDLPF
jgi:single-strand DNA-binding protein